MTTISDFLNGRLASSTWRRLFQRTLAWVVVVVAAVLWSVGFYLTEAKEPRWQCYLIYRRVIGHKDKTVRQWECGSAFFDLKCVIPRQAAHFERTEPIEIPKTWRELVNLCRDETNSHMRGTIATAHPLLFGDRDPWGRPWLYRRIAHPNSKSPCCAYRVKFGSIGPDGIESDEALPGTRMMSDDDFTGEIPCNVWDPYVRGCD